jgi:hypothetical protein
VPRPCRSSGGEQRVLQLGDRQRIDLGIASAITSAFEGVADAVLDKRRSTDLAGAIREKLLPGVRAQRVVASPAEWQVAFFEGVRKNEGTVQTQVAMTFGCITRNIASEGSTITDGWPVSGTSRLKPCSPPSAQARRTTPSWNAPPADTSPALKIVYGAPVSYVSVSPNVQPNSVV